MAKLKAAVRSMRLRTLPLSLSGVILGSFLAASKVLFNWGTIIFLFATQYAFKFCQTSRTSLVMC